MPKIKVSKKEEKAELENKSEIAPDESTDAEEKEDQDKDQPVEEITKHPETPKLDLSAPEVPQIINGIVVPRAIVTGPGHNHRFTQAFGRQTSKVSGKPTETVRFSHPGLKAIVVRKFDHVKQAMEFVNNPSNALYEPKFVDPETVHHDELQTNVHAYRLNQSKPQKKQLIDAPIGSEDEFQEGIYDAE